MKEKQSNASGAGGEAEIPKYTPMVPERWKERLITFSHLHVVKHDVIRII